MADRRVELLDIYAADKPAGPVLVYIHGGYWRSGSKGRQLQLCATFTQRGATVVLVEYDLLPQVTVSGHRLAKPAQRSLGLIKYRPLRRRPGEAVYRRPLRRRPSTAMALAERLGRKMACRAILSKVRLPLRACTISDGDAESACRRTCA